MEKTRSQFQPRIGQQVMLLVDDSHLLCTYYGMDILNNKVNHVYFHQKSGEKLLSEDQIGIKLYEAYALLN